jgi:hypothetical protein
MACAARQPTELKTQTKSKELVRARLRHEGVLGGESHKRAIINGKQRPEVTMLLGINDSAVQRLEERVRTDHR